MCISCSSPNYSSSSAGSGKDENETYEEKNTEGAIDAVATSEELTEAESSHMKLPSICKVITNASIELYVGDTETVFDVNEIKPI